MIRNVPTAAIKLADERCVGTHAQQRIVIDGYNVQPYLYKAPCRQQSEVSFHYFSFRLLRLYLPIKFLYMEMFEQIKRPSKLEQKVALESYNALASVIGQLNAEETKIEIEETKDKIKIPLSALKLLRDILKAMSQGKPISIVPIAAEVTTQKAAEVLGCSRPHLVKLLEDGKIEYTKVGKHRRIKLEDVLQYKKRLKEAQKQHIIDIMNFDEEKELYDS